jgi:hypothetical protein
MEHVKAELKDGVLRIVVPKKAEVQPRRVQLGAASTEKSEKSEKPPATQGQQQAPKKAA